MIETFTKNVISSIILVSGLTSCYIQPDTAKSNLCKYLSLKDLLSIQIVFASKNEMLFDALYPYQLHPFKNI